MLIRKLLKITLPFIIILLIPTSKILYAAPAWYNNVIVSKVVTLAVADGSTMLQIWGSNGCSQQSATDNGVAQFVTNVVTNNTLHLSYIMSMAVSANNTPGKTISFHTDCATNDGFVDQFCVGNGSLVGTC